jgi:7-carboxy-7-deazaguanine synthase
VRISEIYVSVQGEGPRVGVPTVFVRTGGCNLRCPGWPCDTQHAIDPKYRNEWEKVGPPVLMDRITGEAIRVGATNICLTGGEPFIQPARELETLARDLVESGYHVECFSNGTRPYGRLALKYIDFIMDWKLPGSGEDHMHPVRIENINNMTYSDQRHAIKFVIKDWADFVCAKQLWEDFKLLTLGFEVFYGVAWGHLENAELIKWVQEAALPWRLNVQVHNHIWNREDRGI